jgi:hypothetical protein
LAGFWDERYAVEHYVFGEAPNAFLARQGALLPKSGHALAVADGEGRNGVWMAEQGLSVVSVDGSSVAQKKAALLATKRGVALDFVLADLETWEWPEGEMDVVAGIFIQFMDPPGRDRMFARMVAALKPGGLLLLEGYRPEQLAYGTGGPRQVENLYTEALLREAFAAMDIVSLDSYDATLSEGPGHDGMSAVIDLVARRRS